MHPATIQRHTGRFPAAFYQLLETGTEHDLLEYIRTDVGFISALGSDIPAIYPFYSNVHEFSNFNKKHEMKMQNGGETLAFPYLEKWIMWGKANLFGDTNNAKRVLSCDNPADAKRLGRQVNNYDDVAWKRHRYNWMVQGLLLKASSCPEFAEVLVKNAKFAVEGAKNDKIWGVGLDWQDRAIFDIKNWRGTNILGFALMEARHIFLIEQEKREQEQLLARGKGC